MRLFQNTEFNKFFLVFCLFLCSFDVKVRIFSGSDIKKINIRSSCVYIEGKKENSDIDINLISGKIRITSKDKIFYGKEFHLKFCDNEFAVKFKKTERIYNGDLFIYAEKNNLILVNRLDIEDYISGVIEPETRNIKNIEAIKANAVAARSYVFASYKQRHHDERYNFCDLTHCQLYQGKKVLKKEILKALKDTEGYIITYKSKPVWAMYHSVCGGRTEDASNIWGYDTMPYLVGREDKIHNINLCSEGWGYRWKTKISKKRMLKVLRKARLISENENIKELKVYSTFKSGRVEKLAIITSKRTFYIRAIDFYHIIGRNLNWLAIKSIWFDLSSDDRYWIFDGKGYGHGVGMCQVGADKMAEMGYNWKEIIHHYYSGVKIEKISELGL